MPIEESLGRIATALETIAAGAATVVNNTSETPAKRQRSRKPAAAAAPETPPVVASNQPVEEPESTVTRDSVREALRIFRKSNTKAEAIEILAAHGAQSVTKADESSLPALLKAFSV